MSEAIFEKYAEEICLLPYSQRMRLLQKLANSLERSRRNKKKRDVKDFEAAFGMWKEREVSIETIRKMAWER